MTRFEYIKMSDPEALAGFMAKVIECCSVRMCGTAHRCPDRCPLRTCESCYTHGITVWLKEDVG